MRKGALFVALAVTGMAHPANAQGLLGKLNKVLGAVTAPAGSSPAKAPSTMASLDASEHDRLIASLDNVQVDAAAGADLQAARPIIEQTITTISCATDARAFHQLNIRRVKPKNYFTPDKTLILTAMGGMKYHDKSTCVPLSRVANVEKPALNALVMEVYFVSDSSGEASTKTISFRKLNGDWLLDSLGAYDG